MKHCSYCGNGMKKKPSEGIWDCCMCHDHEAIESEYSMKSVYRYRR